MDYRWSTILSVVVVITAFQQPVLGEGNYTCNDGSVIPQVNYCDFRSDCPDGDDEATCPPVCYFEDGMCGWTQNITNAFNWTMWDNNPPSSYTGPTADHTTHSPTGKFLYVDSYATADNTRAVLESPIFGQAGRGCRFSFSYYVYGTDFGTLKVFQHTLDDDRSFNLRIAEDVTDSTDYRDQWNLYSVELDGCVQNFQLQIEGKDKGTYEEPGGYAIDDFRFENCAYALPLATGGTCPAGQSMCDSGHCYPDDEKCDFTYNCCDGTDESIQTCASYHMCDFESGMCDFEQLQDDTKNWKRYKGFTPTTNTGPFFDHTTRSSSGYYLYTEVDGTNPGDTIRLGSFYIQAISTPGCAMRFYYVLRGEGTGSLNVYTRTEVGGPMTLLWADGQPHGAQWIYASVDLQSDADFQVIIEGVTGSSNLGDTGIDDISFTPDCVASNSPLPGVPTDPPIPTDDFVCNDGTHLPHELSCDFREDCSEGEDEANCPSTCNFENGLCKWEQSNSDELDWIYWSNDAPTEYNGPAVDHTMQSVSGHYIYIDSTNSNEGDMAMLRSKMYSKAARGCKFTMWYYVFGDDFGTLKVWQHTPNDGRYYNLLQADDQSDDSNTLDRWNYYEVFVEACAQDFKLSIRAEDTKTTSGVGGYAVDDLRFVDCAYTLPLADGDTCPAGEAMCDSGHCYPEFEACDYTLNCCDGSDEFYRDCAGYHMCDFESSLCNWQQLDDDEQDWTRNKGNTDTGGTGPNRDHTTFTSRGYYLYTEGDGAQPGDRYRLGSFYIQAVTSGCTMRFYYLMRGSGIGGLNVYTRTAINGPLQVVWSDELDRGNMWVYASVSLSSSDNFQVVIEGVRGPNNMADTSIDDISFTPECVFANQNLPVAPTPTPAHPGCPDGQLPCNQGCIDEAKYCDFRQDCLPGSDDEKYCPTSCSFESDLCYWSQDVDDDFDWEWYDPPAYPGFDGPVNDHTTGSTAGHYIYVDGTFTTVNTRARLFSPVYKRSGSGCAFGLWFNVFGPEFGDLEIRLYSADDGGSEQRLATPSDGLSRFNEWIEYRVMIPACSTNFQIILDAEDRQDIPVESGFAVDDVIFDGCEYPEPVAPGACTGSDQQCETGECYTVDKRCDFSTDCCDGSDEAIQLCSQLGYSMCDFEIDLCDWTQMTSDEFDWRRDSGGTGSSGTGPGKDHTTGTSSGYYLYTEASGERRNGDRAKLKSPPFQGTVNGCSMRMYYHMRGDGIGSLTVYTRTQTNGPMTQVWSQDTNQGNVWLYQSVDLRVNNDFEVIIEGTIGYTVKGDIAIDDVSFTPECQAATGPLPMLTTEKIPVVSTLPYLNCTQNGKGFYCKVDRSCLDPSAVCNKQQDCSDGSDEAECPTNEKDNTALYISLGVVFGVLALVAIIGTIIFVFNKHNKNSKSDPTLVSASVPTGMDNPAYTKSDGDIKISGIDVSYSPDSTDY